MGTFTNSEDPDEMLPHKVAFHQGLHCLGKIIPRQKNTIFFENLTSHA